MNTVPNRVKIG